MNDTPGGSGESREPEVTPTTPDESTAAVAEAPRNGSHELPGSDTGSSVLGRLRAEYAEHSGLEERTEVISIAPGIYTDLAAKYRPIDPNLKRKLERRFQRTGLTGAEANLDFQSTLLADACLSIMMRPAPGAEWVEAHRLPEVAELTGGDVVRYDRNLAAILGMDPPEHATQGQIARLVFKEQPIFDVHYTEFSLWSTGLVAEEDDEDEGGGRPT